MVHRAHDNHGHSSDREREHPEQQIAGNELHEFTRKDKKIRVNSCGGTLGALRLFTPGEGQWGIRIQDRPSCSVWARANRLGRSALHWAWHATNLTPGGRKQSALVSPRSMAKSPRRGSRA